MAQTRSEPTNWKAARQLAAELAQWGFDDNLLKTAAAYVKAYPDADMAAWLERLARLGDLFSSSQQTGRYRHQLQFACERVQPRPRTGREWAWVLSWAARLYPYYNNNPAEARRISDVSNVHVPPMAAVYRPKPTTRSAATTPAKATPPEKPSPEAENLFSQLQKRWAEKEKGKK
jgi:hypothetical protein